MYIIHSMFPSADLVPYFKQDPVSYISYPPLKNFGDIYMDFDILLSVKPEANDGQYLYNALSVYIFLLCGLSLCVLIIKHV